MAFRERRNRRYIKRQVIIISKRDEGSYANFLRRVKANSEFTNLKDDISPNRRYPKGDLMLDLRKANDEIVEKFLSPTEKCLGQEADISARKLETTTVCKDIDEITTKEKVQEDLKKQFSLIGLGTKDLTLKTLRKAYSEHKLPSSTYSAALKLLVAGRMRIR